MVLLEAEVMAGDVVVVLSAVETPFVLRSLLLLGDGHAGCDRVRGTTGQCYEIIGPFFHL
jgi:hypothetical protein